MRVFIAPEMPDPPAPGATALLWVRLAPGEGRAAARRVVRAALERLLERWLGAGEHWREGARGPRVVVPGYCASVSYAGDWAVLALGRACRVGADLVSLSALPADGGELSPIAHAFLSPAVATGMDRQPPELQPQAFARAWAAMEAASKALGLELAEWRPAREAALQTCRCTFPPAPDGVCLAVAWAPPLPRAGA